ncbi:MAG: XylR family transcriptional regulator, partial [Planctomycetes bacterium]|nr:XylR family transcriptional regulator [Planctomycetota bacterium]
SSPPLWLKKWNGDGILVRSGNEAIASAVKRVGVPAIELRSTRRAGMFPFVGVDNETTGRMVADHFLDRGFRHFAVYALDTEEFFTTRRDSFIAAVEARGFRCVQFQQAGKSERPRQWELQQAKLARWLEGLPKPTGVLACTDQLGCWLIDACARAEIRVPDDIAVVGVENDEALTSLSSPPLSSVQLDGDRIGYEAASQLDQLMNGYALKSNRTYIPPLAVVTRQSSDIIAVDDPLLAMALSIIRTQAEKGLTVDELLKHVPMSRSSLERNCRKILGRTPNEEINRCRIARVCELLRETDLSLSVIADRTGFQSAQYLVCLFKKMRGLTPGQYRSQPN